METVSENRRGRPARFDPAWVRMVKALHADIKTDRGIIGKCYECQAMRALQSDNGGLVQGIDGIVRTDSSVYRATVLEHLGRLKMESGVDDADIRAAAQWLSSRLNTVPAFTTRKAVELLRALREEIGVRVYFGWYTSEPDKLLKLLVKEDP